MNTLEYNAEPWQAYLLVLAFASLGTSVNIFLCRYLHKLELVAFAFTIAGTASIIIVLWVMGSQIRLSGSAVFQAFTNEGGWSSLGLSMLAGQILMVWCLTGSDATAHMAEETRNSSSVIPRAMMLSYLLNALMVFIMLITFCFCLTDLEAAFDSPTGYPFIQVFADTTGSPAGKAQQETSTRQPLTGQSGGVGLTCVMILLIVFSVTNYMAATSRQVFAFARDKGKPSM